MDKVFCKNCQAFDSKTPQWGECHRKSPYALHDGVLHDRFPKVHPDDWCMYAVEIIVSEQHKISESMGMSILPTKEMIEETKINIVKKPIPKPVAKESKPTAKRKSS